MMYVVYHWNPCITHVFDWAPILRVLQYVLKWRSNQPKMELTRMEMERETYRMGSDLNIKRDSSYLWLLRLLLPDHMKADSWDTPGSICITTKMIQGSQNGNESKPWHQMVPGYPINVCLFHHPQVKESSSALLIFAVRNHTRSCKAPLNCSEFSDCSQTKSRIILKYAFLQLWNVIDDFNGKNMMIQTCGFR